MSGVCEHGYNGLIAEMARFILAHVLTSLSSFRILAVLCPTMTSALAMHSPPTAGTSERNPPSKRGAARNCERNGGNRTQNGQVRASGGKGDVFADKPHPERGISFFCVTPSGSPSLHRPLLLALRPPRRSHARARCSPQRPQAYPTPAPSTPALVPSASVLSSDPSRHRVDRHALQVLACLVADIYRPAANHGPLS
jgi:hypothetical protein